MSVSSTSAGLPDAGELEARIIEALKKKGTKLREKKRPFFKSERKRNAASA